jgi:repressor LexA
LGQEPPDAPRLRSLEGNALSLPVVGQIAAGALTQVGEGAEETMVAPQELRARAGDFWLRVQGDSMQGDGILSQDLVLIRPGITVAQGAIAAVQMERADGSYEATLKHVYVDEGTGRATLCASNPAYPDIELAGEQLHLVGVYRGLVRQAARS